MAENRVCWWEIGAKDGIGLTEFYAQAFGWEASEFGGIGYHTLASGNGKDGGIGGGIFAVEGKCPPYQTIYVEVEDVDDMVVRLAGLGAQALGDPFDVPDVGRIAMLRDPEGNTLGLIAPSCDDAAE